METQQLYLIDLHAVIIDGATAFVYQYRGETQQYQLNLQRFEQGIKNMQTLLVNKFSYVRSTFIPRTGTYNSSSVDKLKANVIWLTNRKQYLQHLTVKVD